MVLMQETNLPAPQPAQNSPFSPKNLPFILLLSFILILFSILATYVVLKPKQIQQIPTQYPNFSSPTPIDKTADWKNYKNYAYGYEFKYPVNWTINETESILTLRPYVYSGSFLSIAPIGNSNSLIKSVFDDTNNKEKVISGTFSGRTALEFPRQTTDIGGGKKNLDRVIRIDNIKGLSWNNKNEIRYQVWYRELNIADTFDKILSTFTFLDQNEEK